MTWCIAMGAASGSSYRLSLELLALQNRTWLIKMKILQLATKFFLNALNQEVLGNISLFTPCSAIIPFNLKT